MMRILLPLLGLRRLRCSMPRILLSNSNNSRSSTPVVMAMGILGMGRIINLPLNLSSRTSRRGDFSMGISLLTCRSRNRSNIRVLEVNITCLLIILLPGTNSSSSREVKLKLKLNILSIRISLTVGCRMRNNNNNNRGCSTRQHSRVSSNSLILILDRLPPLLDPYPIRS